MKRRARWELVRTRSGWHYRFRAANGRVLMWSEDYPTRSNAQRGLGVASTAPLFLEVREVDECDGVDL